MGIVEPSKPAPVFIHSAGSQKQILPKILIQKKTHAAAVVDDTSRAEES